MPDINARMRQLRLTTAEWTAVDPVLGKGEIAIEDAGTAQPKMKIGDGVKKWSALADWAAPTAPAPASTTHGFYISLTGAVLGGAGITVVKSAVGTYELTFATPFANKDKLAIGALCSMATLQPHFATANVASTTRVMVYTWIAGTNPSRVDASFWLTVQELP
jgi:hypothetical protein